MNIRPLRLQIGKIIVELGFRGASWGVLASPQAGGSGGREPPTEQKIIFLLCSWPKAWYVNVSDGSRASGSGATHAHPASQAGGSLDDLWLWLLYVTQ